MVVAMVLRHRTSMTHDVSPVTSLSWNFWIWQPAFPKQESQFNQFSGKMPGNSGGKGHPSAGKNTRNHSKESDGSLRQDSRKRKGIRDMSDSDRQFESNDSNGEKSLILKNPKLKDSWEETDAEGKNRILRSGKIIPMEVDEQETELDVNNANGNARPHSKVCIAVQTDEQIEKERLDLNDESGFSNLSSVDKNQTTDLVLEQLKNANKQTANQTIADPLSGFEDGAAIQGIRTSVDADEEDFEEDTSDSVSDSDSSGSDRYSRRSTSSEDSGRSKSRSRSRSRSRSKKGGRQKFVRERETPVRESKKKKRNEKSSKGKYLKLIEEDPELVESIGRIIAKRKEDRHSRKSRSSESRGKSRVDSIRSPNKRVMPSEQHNSVLAVKSPSADTAYSPTLQKVGGSVLNNVTRGFEQIRLRTPVTLDNHVVFTGHQKKSKRKRSRSRSRRRRSRSRSRSRARSDSRSASTGNREERPLTSEDELRRKLDQEAEDYVITSEKFKVVAEHPPSGNNFDSKYDYAMDDEFLHTTCHVEETAVEKIAKCGFIELPKLRNKVLRKIWLNDKPRLELVNNDGKPYFVNTEDKDNQITNVKAWEQAFRVYIMVFSKANPHRSAEILQYLDTIIHAAGSFIWENVAQYDYAFRKLMERHPNRSWARTHHQMWMYFLRDHIPNTSRGSGSASQSHKTWKEITCWRYNRNKCNKKDCKCEHRCSICGGTSHIALNCYKRKKGGRKSDEHKDKVKKEHQN